MVISTLSIQKYAGVFIPKAPTSLEDKLKLTLSYGPGNNSTYCQSVTI